MLIGVLTLAEYVLSRNLGIDELLFRDQDLSAGTVSPGRMASASTVLLTFLGNALLLLDHRRKVPALCLAFAALGGSYLALMAHVYVPNPLDRMPPYSSMALHTTASFLLLSLGILLARPDRRFVVVLLSDTPGGILARRLLPAAFLVPPILGWLRLTGQRLGYYDARLGIAVGTLSAVGLFAAMIYWTALSLYQLDHERAGAEKKFRMAVESAPNGAVIVDGSGRIVLVNAQMEKMFGFDREELLNQSIDLLGPSICAKVTRGTAPTSLRIRLCDGWEPGASSTDSGRTAASSQWRSG